MIWQALLVGLVIGHVSADLPLAEKCDWTKCQLPDCRCSSTNIPGGLAANNTPQFVLVTFDDAVNILNIVPYREDLYNRQNSNGCPTGTTFYVSHEYTNYQIVNELYNRGYEIALHSISHKTNQTYWAAATEQQMMREFGDQRRQMSYFANIPLESVKGLRIPFLQMTGNASFEMMAKVGLKYDCSWPTQHNEPAIWPYTLDYASTQECMIPPCPNASIPGVWVLPMVSWHDLNEVPCSMADACYYSPNLDDENAWYNYIISNFERHYRSNRAPFGFYIHEAYLAANHAVRRAFVRFMNYVNGLPDVFMVNSSEVIDYVQNPVSLEEYKKRPCRKFVKTSCERQSCGPLSAEHNVWSSYFMQICTTCPKVYPWLGNPMGE